MKPTDLQSVEAWAQLERELPDSTGLTVVVFDAENARVTETMTSANELCPLVKGRPESVSQICAMAQQSLLAATRHTGEPVVDECDAGMVKLVVPMFSGDHLVGSISGWGRRLADGELEHGYVADSTGESSERVRTLARTVGDISREQAERVAAGIHQRVRSLLEH